MVFNNGIEFVVIYFIMFLVLFIYGGGCFFSVDYYVNKVMCFKSN